MTFDEIAEAQGWNDESRLAVALAYIESQQDDAAFDDFAQHIADEENA